MNGRELLVVRERGFVQLTCMTPCSFLSLTIFDNLFSLVLVFLVGCFCFVLILYFPNSCFLFKRTNPNSYKWLLLNFYIWIEDYETGKKKKVRLGISDAWNPSPWEVEIGGPGVHSLGYMRPLFKMRILVSRSKWHCVCFFFLVLISAARLRLAYVCLFRYTRNLVDQGNGKFNLMILCWGEGHGR